MNELTEFEINNFAYSFINLIKDKNGEIGDLKKEIRELKGQLNSLLSISKLTADDVLRTERPVWVVTKNTKRGFYALPTMKGVIDNRNGKYNIFYYEKTWIAFSEKPVEPVEITWKESE